MSYVMLVAVDFLGGHYIIIKTNLSLQWHDRLLSPLSSMAPHVSDDLRCRIIHWHHEYSFSPDEISILAGCSVRTV
jgi:hypothetical protein